MKLREVKQVKRLLPLFFKALVVHVDRDHQKSHGMQLVPKQFLQKLLAEQRPCH